MADQDELMHRQVTRLFGERPGPPSKAFSQSAIVSDRNAEATPAGERRPWFTPGVGGIATASFLADVGHEIPTSLLPSFVTATLGAPALLGVVLFKECATLARRSRRRGDGPLQSRRTSSRRFETT